MPLVLLLVSQKKPSSSDDPEFESGGAQQRRKPAPSYLDTEEFLSFPVPAPRLSLQPRRLGRAAAQAWLSWGMREIGKQGRCSGGVCGGALVLSSSSMACTYLRHLVLSRED